MRDVPWRRTGALRYGLARLRAAIRPPVTVVPAPAGLCTLRNVPVPMRDGVTLRVNVYRPEGDGPFPVLMSAHPYGKDNLPSRTRWGWRLSFQFRLTNQPAPMSFSSETGWEAPDPVWWTSRGYAVVNADLRGAGTSDGVGTLLDDAEAADVHDLIEWAGTQPWSTGKVGLLGVSYLALSQYKAAALHPPHLAAICPWEGFTDVYRDFMLPGGVMETGFSRLWATITRRSARLSVDLLAGRRQHPLRDEWWTAMVPDLPAITVPRLVCASFSDANLHSVGSMRAFEQASSAEKHVFTHRGPKWSTFYGPKARQAQQRFFDRHLRGLDAPRLPPVRLEVRSSRRVIAEVRAEQEWPLARTRWQALALAPGGRMLAPSIQDAVVAPGSHRFDLRGPGLAFELAIDEALELTGPMALHLWLSFDGACDAALFAGVEKFTGRRWVPFEGSYGYGRDRIAVGRQLVSLRRLDTAASLPGRPVHPFTAREPVAEGEVVSVDIALGASSTLFQPGDRLRLLLAGRDLEPRNPLFGHFPARYRPSPRGHATLHWGGAHPSALTVPVIPRTAPA